MLKNVSKKEEPKNNKFNMRLSDEEAYKLGMMSSVEGKSKSDILREALNNYYLIFMNRD